MLIEKSKSEKLSDILRFIGEELDIPENIFAAMRERYSKLAEWLKKDHIRQYSSDAEIYHQGSLRLGTSVRPVKSSDEYDVDLVYRRDIKKESTSQNKLKDELAEQLKRYVQHLKSEGEIIPEVKDGRRCITLNYKGQFHMDILPALPDDEAVSFNLRNLEDGILIPDRDLHEWLHSNPKGYTDWFNDQQKVLLLERLETMAKAANVDVDTIPKERVPTPLRRIVQILKRHRDIRFQGNPKDKPISIIITTLAAGAYTGESNVYEGLMNVLPLMRKGIKKIRDEWWVPNPVNPKENFADKWRKDQEPQRANRFFEWLTQAEADFVSIGNQSGVHKILESFNPIMGETLVKNAAERYGRSVDDKHIGGSLKMASKTGILGASGTSVKKNTWYGS